MAITTEVEILKKISHPCIVRIHELIDTADSVYIVLDLIEGGELFDKIVEISRYPEPAAKFLFYQMVLAIRYVIRQFGCRVWTQTQNQNQFRI